MGDMTDSTPAMLAKDHLVADGRSSLFTGWVFKFGKLPEGPDQVITLIDQGDRASFPHLLIDYSGLQVLVRSARAGEGYKSSYLMMRQVRDILLGLCGHPTSFVELWGITERSNITPLGYDENDRHTWSWNARLTIEPPTNALTHRAAV